MLERKIDAREIMYGVNTGIGEFSEVVLTDEQVQQFQRYLIYNHAAGIGEPCADRARARGHARPHQRPRPRPLRLPAGDHPDLVDDAQQGVTPVVCEKGTVGACGDLAPMSQIALPLMGEGEAFYQGERMPTREAMEQRRHPGPRPEGARRPGLHQRLEPHHRPWAPCCSTTPSAGSSRPRSPAR